ncbi:DUF2927 domain-containing protein [Pontibaca methylaminivorans]|uniref:DUF2927 domain-containing protein n=1 Tax=Pontibaca methylaminivorans TaxID=515897 RepID=UPI002FD933DB
MERACQPSWFLTRLLPPLLLLGACGPQPSGPSVISPPTRPDGLAQLARPAATEPSEKSRELQDYYLQVQDDLLARGLLRIDGGGADTSFSPRDLVRNFEEIAFSGEYSRGGGYSATGSGRGLSRWSEPVRISTVFGASVPLDQRRRDQAAINGYAQRLAAITGHPVQSVPSGGNFHIFIVGEDDREHLLSRLDREAPMIGATERGILRNLPRSFYCLMLAVSKQDDPHDYARAIALIRSEHPDLVRLACIHEEIAQGLGLPNDSLSARPSIFNDDDEFALLTRHDEMLLRMLYDPRLRPGMTVEEAHPIALRIAHELMDATS